MTTCTCSTHRKTARRVERPQAQLARLRDEAEALEAATFEAWISGLETRLAAGGPLTASEQLAVFGRRTLRSIGGQALSALSELGNALNEGVA